LCKAFALILQALNLNEIHHRMQGEFARDMADKGKQEARVKEKTRASFILAYLPLLLRQRRVKDLAACG
jgi:hypothetical protein